jgi:secreted trypsin-like serine protease
MRAKRFCGLLPFLICAAWAGTAAAQPRIYGGTASAVCGWPSAVELDIGCTGTLVAPTVVISAAHCVGFGAPPSAIIFGESDTSPAKSIGVTECVASPDYDGNSAANDISYCLLSEAVTDVPLVPILMGCEADEMLTAGTPVTIVGFGMDESDNYGTKREVVTAITNVQDGELFAGGDGKDSCSGDSGGPVFVRLDDGTWRVTGITSYGGECGTGGVYGMMHDNVDWVEQETGIDVTPCFDADGTWNPTTECADAPTAPGTSGGTWSAGCDEGDVLPADYCAAADADTDADTDADSDSDADSDTDSDSDSDSDSDADGDAGAEPTPLLHDDSCSCAVPGAAPRNAGVLSIAMALFF